MIELRPIDLLLSVAVGLNIVALLLIWLQRKAGLPASSRDMSEAQEALRTAQVELPPRALGERIFAEPDWDFISFQAPLRVQRLFRQERKAVTLSWLRHIREQVRQLRRFHRGRPYRPRHRPSSASTSRRRPTARTPTARRVRCYWSARRPPSRTSSRTRATCRWPAWW